MKVTVWKIDDERLRIEMEIDGAVLWHGGMMDDDR